MDDGSDIDNDDNDDDDDDDDDDDEDIATKTIDDIDFLQLHLKASDMEYVFGVFSTIHSNPWRIV